MSTAPTVEPYPLESLITLATESGYSKIMMQSERAPMFCSDQGHQDTGYDPVPSDSMLSLIRQLMGNDAERLGTETFEPQSISWQGHDVMVAPMRIPIKPQRFMVTVRIGNG